jgi:hypothetical protein
MLVSQWLMRRASRVAQFLASELAVTDHSERGRCAMSLSHALPRQRHHDFEDLRSEIAQMIGERLERQSARQVLSEQPQCLNVLEMPQQVHLLFEIVFCRGELDAQR